jgi:hypothetical protein
MRSKEEVAALLDAAEKLNAHRDATDRMAGFAAPGDGPLYVTINTIMAALEAALALDDPSTLAEAYDMLRQLYKKISPS